jgi:hypothetical protein
MVHNIKRLGMLAAASLTAAGLILASCSPAPQADLTATPDSGTQLTAVAHTVAAEKTRVAGLTPTATLTPVPTNTQAVTATATSNPASPTPAFTATATTALVADKAEFVSQSVADNTKFSPGATFSLTWRMKNVGTTTWTTAYLLRLYAGPALGAPASVNFPREVKPGEEVELTLNMTAPSSGGQYQSSWVLTNAEGANFFPVYIIIEVTGAAATATTAPATNTPEGATNTPEPATNTPEPTAASG